MSQSRSRTGPGHPRRPRHCPTQPATPLPPPVLGSAARAAEAEAEAYADAGRQWPESLSWRFWRSPADQPRWARPGVAIVTALAGRASTLALRSGLSRAFLRRSRAQHGVEPAQLLLPRRRSVGVRVRLTRSRACSCIQALSPRIFGFHVWALVLAQVVEGMLTVLVLYRAVRRVAGAGAGLVAAVVLAGSPIVILLDRGNISDSLLILLLVLAADATIRACQTGRLRSLFWAGALVGFAFQAKMLQAWLVLPALFLAYLVAAPAVFPPAGGARGHRHPRGGRRLPQLDVGRLPRPAIQPSLRRRQLQRLALQPGVLYNGFTLPRFAPSSTRRAAAAIPPTWLTYLRRAYASPSRRHRWHRRVVGPPAARSLRPRCGLAAAAGGGGRRLALRPGPPYARTDHPARPP